MNRRRSPKKSDQINIEKGYQILREAMLAHPEIEMTLWAGACWSLLINGYLDSGITFENFCNEVDSVKEHYKIFWKDK